MKTVYDALKLLNSGHPNKQSGFMTCYSWYFELEGVTYRLCEMRGHYLRLEKYKPLPRETIHEISLKGDNEDG